MNKEFLVKNGVQVDEALKVWGDIETYNDNVKDYFNTLLSKESELKKYKDTNDLNNYSILVHSMKSEAKYFGFMKEAEVFLAHELKSKENDSEYVNIHYPEIIENVKNIYKILSEYLGIAKKNILAVDDSMIVLNFIEANLPNEYHIIKSNNGIDAIAKLESMPIYALFLDLNMPSSNGFEVLNYLKEKNLIEKIPVIIITGDDTANTIEKAFSYPILDVLNKPFTPENMLRILETVNNFYERKKHEI